MSHTDLGQPDLAALRAAAGGTESAEAVAGLGSSCGFRSPALTRWRATWPARSPRRVSR
jgi:hypothetical protein